MGSRFLLARLIALVCLAAACGAPSGDGPRALRVVATPVVTPVPTPPPTPVVTASPVPATAKVTARPRPAKPAAAPTAQGLAPFQGLGAWVDVFDYDNEPASLLGGVDDLAARGVRTLYLETSRFDRPNDIDFPRTVAAVLERAHARGMKVVAWYPPSFQDVAFEVRKSLGAIRYTSPNGHRFDAFGADIERSDVKDVPERTARTIEYSRQIRAAAGGMALAAITYPPSAFERNQSLWPNFPWRELAAIYDVFMPMSYWTYRGTDPQVSRSQTESNLAKTREYTGRPVHIIGGEAAKTDVAQAAEYVRSALAGGSIGGSLYDYRTTRADVWAELAALNR